MRLSEALARLGAPDTASTEVFGMPAHLRRFDRTVFLVPDYAAHVPVARRILDGSLVSEQLHLLVRDVMARRPGSMVHAGTFFGDMLTSFSRKTPGTVYAFEPVLENYLFAHAALERNALENVLLFHAGLAADNHVAQVETGHRRTGRHRGGASHLVGPGHRHPLVDVQRVPTLTVDQLGIADLTLIQLDVEGYEPHVLRGAEATISTHRPVIVVEDKRDRCRRWLVDRDYVEVRRIGEDRVYVPVEHQVDRARPVRGGDPST